MGVCVQLLGCLAGGGVGAGVGAVGSKNKKGQNALLGAALGCAIGGVVGGGAGAYIADKQEQFATKEQQLDSMIADVRGENQKLSQLISNTQMVIADDKARMDQIDQQLASGKITMDQCRAIAEEKMEDLNAHTIDAGALIIAGTARSMGVDVEGN